MLLARGFVKTNDAFLAFATVCPLFEKVTKSLTITRRNYITSLVSAGRTVEKLAYIYLKLSVMTDSGIERFGIFTSHSYLTKKTIV